MDPAVTKWERETLKAISRLPARARGRVGSDAHTGALAEALGVSPGTATATVKRLAEPGPLDHKPYPGVELTITGRRAAVAAMRPHPTVERVLSAKLRHPRDQARPPARSVPHPP